MNFIEINKYYLVFQKKRSVFRNNKFQSSKIK